MRKYLVFSAIALGAAGVGGWLMTEAGTQPEATPESFDIVRGETLYAEYCAACHGANLGGAARLALSGA